MIDARAKPAAPTPIEVATALARQPVQAVDVPEKSHLLVAKTLVAARKAQPDRNGAIAGLGGEVFWARYMTVESFAPMSDHPPVSLPAVTT